MSLQKSKEQANKHHYGLIDPMVKCLCNYIDFDTIKTIYDIGSRDCLQSLELLTAFPTSLIYAFEPNPESLSTCISNIGTNKQITLVPVAVSDVNGEISFFAQDTEKSYDVNIGVSSIYKLMDKTPNNWQWVQKEIKVCSLTLNNYISNKNPSPDLIWIDVQGAELAGFKGASDILPNVKAIFTEAGKIAYYHGHGMFNEIDTYLTSFGFKNVLEVPGHSWESDFLYVKI